MSETLDFFVAGGTLRATDPSYVTRPADHDLWQQLQAGEFCYVLTPRQMGKSSLMVRTAQRLRTDGTRVAVIDLTSIGTGSSELSADQWYLGLLSRVRTQLRLTTDVQRWWDDHAALGIAQRFTTFLHDVLLAECSEAVVNLIDEIDSTLNLNFRDDFFAAIRAVYNERATDPSYQRLTFALFGVATPTDLIQDRERTPFNIGRRIDLSEFTLTDAQLLRNGLAISFPLQADAMLQRIFYWTNGHPYLTQKLCQVLQSKELVDEETIIVDQVDDAVQNIFLSEEGRKDPNLTFVQDRIASSPNTEKRRMLQLYQRVQRSDNVPDDNRSPVQNRLELYGLIGVRQGRLQVRNRIYQQVFDSVWIASMMLVDRRQRRAILAGIGALVLAVGVAIFIFFQPATECSVFSEQFTENEDSNVRLSALANLFSQGERCRNIALDLFYSLQPEEHESLFLDLNNYPDERERLITVIDGVSQTLDTFPAHDLNLMGIWLIVLQNAGVNKDDPLVILLNNWRVGRHAFENDDLNRAIAAYSDANKSTVSNNNFVLHYDLAMALLEDHKYDKAVKEFETIILMTQNMPAIPTPTMTPIPQTSYTPSLVLTLSTNLTWTSPLTMPKSASTRGMEVNQPPTSATPSADFQIYTTTKSPIQIVYQRRFQDGESIRRLVRENIQNDSTLLLQWQEKSREKLSNADIKRFAVDEWENRSIGNISADELNLLRDTHLILYEKLSQVPALQGVDLRGSQLANTELDFLIEGSYRKLNQRLELAANLYAGDGTLLETIIVSNNFDGNTGETMICLLDLQNQLAEIILQALEVQVELQMFKTLASIPTNSCDALRLNNNATALIMQNDLSSAQSLLEQALIIDSRYADAYNNLGQVFYRQQKWEKATEQYRRALEIRLNSPVYLYNLALAEEQMHNYEVAIQAYEAAIALDPLYHEALNNLGFTYLLTNQLEKAVDTLQRGLLLAPSAPYLHKNLGRAYLAQDNAVAAISALQEAIRLFPGIYAEALYYLAIARADIGELDAACASLRRYMNVSVLDGPKRAEDAMSKFTEWMCTGSSVLPANSIVIPPRGRLIEINGSMILEERAR